MPRLDVHCSKKLPPVVGVMSVGSDRVAMEVEVGDMTVNFYMSSHQFSEMLEDLEEAQDKVLLATESQSDA